MKIIDIQLLFQVTKHPIEYRIHRLWLVMDRDVPAKDSKKSFF